MTDLTTSARPNMIEELRSGLNHFRARCSDLEYQNADLRRRLAHAERHMADGWSNVRKLRRQLRAAEHQLLCFRKAVLAAPWFRVPEDLDRQDIVQINPEGLIAFAGKAMRVIDPEVLS